MPFRHRSRDVLLKERSCRDTLSLLRAFCRSRRIQSLRNGAGSSPGEADFDFDLEEHHHRALSPCFLYAPPLLLAARRLHRLPGVCP